MSLTVFEVSFSSEFSNFAIPSAARSASRSNFFDRKALELLGVLGVLEAFGVLGELGVFFPFLLILPWCSSWNANFLASTSTCKNKDLLQVHIHSIGYEN